MENLEELGLQSIKQDWQGQIESLKQRVKELEDQAVRISDCVFNEPYITATTFNTAKQTMTLVRYGEEEGRTQERKPTLAEALNTAFENAEVRTANYFDGRTCSVLTIDGAHVCPICHFRKLVREQLTEAGFDVMLPHHKTGGL